MVYFKWEGENIAKKIIYPSTLDNTCTQFSQQKLRAVVNAYFTGCAPQIRIQVEANKNLSEPKRGKFMNKTNHKVLLESAMASEQFSPIQTVGSDYNEFSDLFQLHPLNVNTKGASRIPNIINSERPIKKYNLQVSWKMKNSVELRTRFVASIKPHLVLVKLVYPER